MAKKKAAPEQQHQETKSDNTDLATMNDVLDMVKGLTEKGYNWEHPLVLRWQYDDEPYVFELVVVNDKSQLVFDEHKYGLH